LVKRLPLGEARVLSPKCLYLSGDATQVLFINAGLGSLGINFTLLSRSGSLRTYHGKRVLPCGLAPLALVGFHGSNNGV
jgi:hypothetical protein